HMIRIWDLAGRHEVGQIFDQSRVSRWNIGALAVAERDGRLIVIAGSGDGAPRVWDVQSRALLAELTGHTARICSAGVADCDGELLAATGSDDSTARLWRLADFTPFGTAVAGHDGGVNALAFIRIRGRAAVVTGDGDGVLRCWDVRSQQLLDVPFTRHDLRITSLTTGTLGGGDVLGVASADGTVRVWRLADETLLAELPREATGKEEALAPDDLLCVGTNSGLVTFALTSGRGPARRQDT